MGGLDEKVSEALMWELFVQSGPVGEYNIFFMLELERVMHNMPLHVPRGHSTCNFFFCKCNYEVRSIT